MRLSVLDQSPIPEGSTGADALRNTLDLARLCDDIGYHRYWVAEHHGTPMLAGTTPEVLISAIGAGACSAFTTLLVSRFIPPMSMTKARAPTTPNLAISCQRVSMRAKSRPRR